MWHECDTIILESKGYQAVKLSNTYMIADLMRKLGYDFKEESRPEVVAMKKSILSLEDKAITFATTIYQDGSWISKSKNIPGLLTGGRDRSQMDAITRDAIFTYYGIPAQYSRDSILLNLSQPVTSEQQVKISA